MLGEMMRKSCLLFMGNFSIENAQKVLENVLIAVKEGKDDRDLAESTAEKDGVVTHIITERQKPDLHWSTMQ